MRILWSAKNLVTYCQVALTGKKTPRHFEYIIRNDGMKSLNFFSSVLSNSCVTQFANLNV